MVGGAPRKCKVVVSGGYIGDLSRNNGDYKIALMVAEHANHSQCTQHTSKIFEKKSG